MIKINNLIKNYNVAGEVVHASNNISYDFEEKGLYFILGKSGCGKTTLLNVLAGLDSYDEGDIIVNGQNISKLNEKELDEYRNIHIGIVFQEFNLLSDINVYDNLRIVLELQGEKADTKQKRVDERNKITQILSDVGLSGYEKRKINELSGGERQRIAIARCLLKKTDIIFADEPTGNLDKKTGECILELLKQISKTRLVIVVTHDGDAAYRYGDNIINMSDGKIIGDDRNVSCENNCLYSFDIDNGINESVKFKNIDANKMTEVIKRFVINSKEGIDFSIKNIKKTENNLLEKENSYQNKEDSKEEIKSCDLSTRYKLKLSLLFMNKRKIRFFFTTVLLALTCMLFYCAIYISFYDKNQIIVKYLNENNVAIFPCYVQCEYEDDFYKINKNSIYKGKFLENTILSSISEYVSVGKVIYDQVLANVDYYFTDATIFFVNDNDDYPDLLEGELPKAYNEIILSDYIADEMNLKVNDYIEFGITQCKVVGIFETDYLNINLKSKLVYGTDDPFFRQNCMYNYFVVYASEELLIEHENVVETLQLQAANFMQKRHKGSYFEIYIKISDTYGLSENDLIEGRLPQNDNEILVSDSFAEQYDLLNGKYTEEEYGFIDIYDERYNNTFSDKINIYDYYKDGIKIVGIVETTIDRMQRDIFIHSDKWNEIKKDYIEYFCSDYIVFADENCYEELIDKADENGLMFDEPAIECIILFDEAINEIKPILYLLLVVTMAINFIMIGTFINISINENKKNIGILRSLGVKMKECIHIFALEFVVIFMLSIVVVIPAILYIINMANNLYMSELDGVNFCIIDKSYLVFAVMIVLEIIINVVSICIPIRKIKKKKPIEIINNI